MITMEAGEGPSGLLPRLVEVYGPPRVIQPYGRSLIIPNVLYTRVLSRDLEGAGLRSFIGQLNGRVAWIIPLNQHRLEDPPGQAEHRFGRPWTREEDQLLLGAWGQGLSMRETGRRLAARLDRTPDAIRTRLRKLAKGRRREAAVPESTEDSRTSEPSQDRTVSSDVRRVVSLLSACLCLAEDPRHLPAIKVLLSEAIQLLQGRAGEATSLA